MIKDDGRNINIKLPKDLRDAYRRACNNKERREVNQSTVLVRLLSIFLEFTKERFCHDAARFVDRYYKIVEVSEEEYDEFKKKIKASSKPRIIKDNPFL